MPNYEKQSPFYAHHVRFINSCTINCIQDNLQLSCFCGLTDTGFSSVQLVFLHSRKACRRHGFCTHCATSAHAAVHSIPKYKKETAVPFLYLKRDTNTGGAEVPCHGIILDGTLETCCTHQNYKKHNIKT